MTIRPARGVEAWGIAALHAEIAGGFLPTLGTAFLTRLYKALIAWPAADVLVAEQDGSPAGFVASVEDAGAFYKHFAARHGVLAGLAALPRLVRPSVMKRAIETFRYGTGDDAIDDDAPVIRAELFAIATSSESRGQGLGSRLIEAATEQYRARGLNQVKVVVGADNEASLAVHRKGGFVDHATIELHRGETSKVLVWSA